VPIATEIPLTQSIATSSTTLSLVDNSVLISEAGTYLVSIFANGTNGTDPVIVALYINDVASSDYVIENIGNGSSSVSASRTFIINANAGDKLSLYNNSNGTITVSDASISVLALN
jgi:hypothetical protein